MERMIVNLSIIFARRGMSSLTWTPATFVSMGRNSPRTSRGASGFRSTMSWCGAPPGRRTLMIALCDRPTPERASARSNEGSDMPRPAVARVPTRMKSRRETPSQNLSDVAGPSIVNTCAVPSRVGPEMPTIPFRQPLSMLLEGCFRHQVVGWVKRSDIAKLLVIRHVMDSTVDLDFVSRSRMRLAGGRAVR